MEAWDDEQRVRPIEITDDDLLPVDGAPLPEPTRINDRAWLPLAVSVTAVAVLIGSVTLLGAVEFDNPPAPESFTATTVPGTPTATAPRSLAEAIPGWTGMLTLATTHEDAFWVLRWKPSFIAPEPNAMTTPWETEWVGAAFSSTGEYVAAFGARNGVGMQFDVLVNPPMGFGLDIDIADAYSATWHADEPGKIAWMEPTGNASTLTVGDMDGSSSKLSERSSIGGVPADSSIVRWDDDGFVIQNGQDIVVLDPRGEDIWATPGFVHSSSPNTLVAVLPTVLGSQWVFLDRESGESTSLVTLGIDATPELTVAIAATDQDTFAAATFRIDKPMPDDVDEPVISRTTLTIISSEMNAPRIIQVDKHVVPIQFATGTPFLVLRDVRSNDLVFVHWRSGATHVFDVPRGHSVLAVHLGEST